MRIYKEIVRDLLKFGKDETEINDISSLIGELDNFHQETFYDRLKKIEGLLTDRLKKIEG